MNKLLEIKDKAVKFCGEYEHFILPVVRFAVAFIAFITIDLNIGYMAKISSMLVEGVLTACNPNYGSLSYVQARRCVSKQIGRHDAACQGCPRCVSRSPVLGTPQSRTALWGEEKQRSD